MTQQITLPILRNVRVLKKPVPKLIRVCFICVFGNLVTQLRAVCTSNWTMAYFWGIWPYLCPGSSSPKKDSRCVNGLQRRLWGLIFSVTCKLCASMASALLTSDGPKQMQLEYLRIPPDIVEYTRLHSGSFAIGFGVSVFR